MYGCGNYRYRYGRDFCEEVFVDGSWWVGKEGIGGGLLGEVMDGSCCDWGAEGVKIVA